jgi:hypothetical protein
VGGEGSGKSQNPSGIVLREVYGPALLWASSTLASVGLWYWKKWASAPESCRRQRSAHSRAWPFLLGQILKADGRPGLPPVPRLPWEPVGGKVGGTSSLSLTGRTLRDA